MAVRATVVQPPPNSKLTPPTAEMTVETAENVEAVAAPLTTILLPPDATSDIAESTSWELAHDDDDSRLPVTPVMDVPEAAVIETALAAPVTAMLQDPLLSTALLLTATVSAVADDVMRRFAPTIAVNVAPEYDTVTVDAAEPSCTLSPVVAVRAVESIISVKAAALPESRTLPEGAVQVPQFVMEITFAEVLPSDVNSILRVLVDAVTWLAVN